MPDITMCQNSDCPLAESCGRFNAVPNEYQSYAMFAPDENGDCEFYIEEADTPGE